MDNEDLEVRASRVVKSLESVEHAIKTCELLKDSLRGCELRLQILHDLEKYYKGFHELEHRLVCDRIEDAQLALEEVRVRQSRVRKAS